MIPEIKKIEKKASDIFRAEIIENSKLKYLNLRTKRKNKWRFQGDEAWGVYLMFFQKYLIYIGRYCGKKSVTDRWEKHLKTDTSRFQRVNFEVIPGKAPYIDQERLEKLEEIKNNIIKRYSENDLNKSNLYQDVIEDILKINSSYPKEYLQILANDGNNQSPNRLRVANFFWNDLKNRNKSDIFNDFEFYYFKFKNFNNFIPNNYPINDIKDEFEKAFEKHLIKKYSPPANDDNDKSDKEFKFIHNISITNEVEEQLKELYDKQTFFLK